MMMVPIRILYYTIRIHTLATFMVLIYHKHRRHDKLRKKHFYHDYLTLFRLQIRKKKKKRCAGLTLYFQIKRLYDDVPIPKLYMRVDLRHTPFL